MEPIGKTRSTTATCTSGLLCAMVMAMLAHKEDVPAPPFGLRNTISDPLASLVSALFTQHAIYYFDQRKHGLGSLTKYSVNPASKHERTRAGCGSLLRATNGVFAVRASCRKRVAKSSPFKSANMGSMMIRSGRSRQAMINPSFPDAACRV